MHPLAVDRGEGKVGTSFCICLLHNFQLFVIMILLSSFFWQGDRAAMLDEVLDYVKFLRLQVKVKELPSFNNLTYPSNK